MRSSRRSRNSSFSEFCVILSPLALSACATTEALLEAPEEFWITVEKLVFAVLQDLESLLALLGA